MFWTFYQNKNFLKCSIPTIHLKFSTQVGNIIFLRDFLRKSMLVLQKFHLLENQSGLTL
jgi:hypothetical protein